MSRPPLNRILVVEDEPDIRAVLELCLRSLGGFEVLLCASGAEAIERAAGFGPDLLLLDVMMPALDGPATLRRLRAQPALAPVPAVFLTAKVQPGEVSALQEQGAVDVVAKPFDPMSICGQLQDLWARLHG